MKIKYLNKEIKLTEFDCEPDNLMESKINFIKEMEKEKINPNLVNKYSKIWINIKYRKCKYPSSIYYFIKKFDSTI